MTITTVKSSLSIAVAIALSACGGGGGGSSSSPTPTPTPTPTNSAPTVSNFSAETIDNTVTFTWQVSDSDGDAVSCTLVPGGSLETVTIDDCIATTSATLDYSENGEFNVTLTATDANSANDSATTTASINYFAEPLPAPVVTAGDNELVIFYNRPDDNYTGWILHLWNNDECDAYQDYESGAGTEWATGKAQTGIDPNYGAYWLLDLKTSNPSCANFIVHKGDEKDLGGIDQKADLSSSNMFWTLSGISELYEERTLYPSGVLIENTAAHWLDAEHLVWDAASAGNVAKVRVYSSDVDDMGFDGETGISGDNFIEYTPNSGTHPASTLNLPRYSGLDAYSSSNVQTSKVKSMLTGKLLAIAYDNNENVLAATYVQTPAVIDAIYTQGNDDADEQTLGLVYGDDAIMSYLWAPTAKSVALEVFNDDKELVATLPMTMNIDTGIWTADVSRSHDRAFYQFDINVYHHHNQKFEQLKVTDPYSVSLSTNGEYSQFVNLDDSDLMPSDWLTHQVPSIVAPEDAVIYEGHIRDFSIRDESTSSENRGKYLAFTESDSVPVQHLKALADAGLTHFQMLPANDIASINEDESSRINLNNTVGELCDVSPAADVCSSENSNATLLSVFESFDGSSEDAQSLANSMRGLDSFNWGYDPKHFNVPDGSYASNADGVARIKEMREMNQAIHEMGLRVVLDVVYNHTNSSGLWDNSVLDKVVPGYYHRRNLTSGNVETETCCQDTAPEHEMMDKLMQDSLALWASAYKFDGFRFDIMANNSVESILSARDVVQAIDADNYFYGEGWTRPDRGYEQAQQDNMAGSEVGTFNDRPRDTIRSASLFSENGSLSDQDTIRLGLTGTIADYQLQDKNGNVKSGSSFSQSSYAKDPADIINYVSKHDNQALWDQLQYGFAANMTTEQRVRAHNIAATLPLMSQGIPFFQFGGDFIRSKSMDRNSYDSGDWFNYVDFTMTTNNWKVGLPLAQDNQDKWSQITTIFDNSESEVTASDMMMANHVFKDFLNIRNDSPLFRLTTAQDIIDRIGFHNTGSGQTQGLIVMSIDDGETLNDIDSQYDAIVVVINGSDQAQNHSILTAKGFELHGVQQASQDATVASAQFTENANSGTFSVPALTTAVFVKPQAAEQGYGLPADITLNAPDIAPYGDNKLYLSGTFNDFGQNGYMAEEQLNYVGDNQYEVARAFVAGEHKFVVASEDGQSVLIEQPDLQFTDNSISVTGDVNDNIVINLAADSTLTIGLDVSDTALTMSIIDKSPTVDCDALADSNEDIPFDISGSGQLYVRGSHSGWNPEEAYRMHYKGNNIYQAVASFDGDFQFKLASDDGSWTTQLWARSAGSNDINSENLDVGVNYVVAYNNAGTDNNSANLPAGDYSIKLTLNSANPAQGFDVGQLIIQQCQP